MVLSAVLMASPGFAASTHRTLGSSHSGTHAGAAHLGAAHTGSAHSKSSHKAVPKPHKLHGQTAIEPARVTEIQEALIRERYLSAEANGKWDATTEAAMQKYQADQGWQTKLMPDSRALKKLGLGPDYSNAINAKNSSFAAPPPVSTIPAEQVSGFAQAAGVNH
ncbi:MAG: peptidoglycan-binding domain-containing protein [Terracidiphilus sp.]|nr:peptidoglycan-binding domain-containing protein [Terracidiphilus sp.]